MGTALSQPSAPCLLCCTLDGPRKRRSSNSPAWFSPAWHCRPDASPAGWQTSTTGTAPSRPSAPRPPAPPPKAAPPGTGSTPAASQPQRGSCRAAAIFQATDAGARRSCLCQHGGQHQDSGRFPGTLPLGPLLAVMGTAGCSRRRGRSDEYGSP